MRRFATLIIVFSTLISGPALAWEYHCMGVDTYEGKDVGIKLTQKSNGSVMISAMYVRDDGSKKGPVSTCASTATMEGKSLVITKTNPLGKARFVIYTDRGNGNDYVNSTTPNINKDLRYHIPAVLNGQAKLLGISIKDAPFYCAFVR